MPIKCVVGGQLAGAQRWSVGFWFGYQGPTGEPSPEAMTTLAGQWYTDWINRAWSTTTSLKISSLIGSRGTVDSVRAYWYPETESQATVVGVSTAAATAGTGTVQGAPQVAMVCTLLTGQAGRRYRGRVYIPAPVVTNTTANVLTPDPQALATTIADFLSAARLRAIIGGTLYPGVRSIAADTTQPITSVRVDNVADTQRRRRDKIAPTAYGAASIIVP